MSHEVKEQKKVLESFRTIYIIAHPIFEYKTVKIAGLKQEREHLKVCHKVDE